MNESRGKRAAKNVIYSSLVKFLTFAIGIIIPRLVIIGYGSEINGLLQTVANLYSYLALIMAGVGVAAIQGLYKPISEKNHAGISAVLVATRIYFRRLVRWYALGALIFSVLFPVIIRSEISELTIFAVVFIEGLSSTLTYYYTYTVQSLLSADGKDYVIQIIQFVVFLITSAVKIGLVLFGVNIVVIEIAYLLINIFQITMYQLYVKNTYSWINWNEKPNTNVLANRKHFMVNGIAWTVFSSTDTIIITMFCGLMYSSVYGLYNMIFANLNLIFAIFYNSIYFILGQVYHEDKKRYIKLHDGFESVISALVFGFLSITYILVLPFFKLYTRGIADINYIDSYLPFLFCAVQILSNCRMISGNLINLTNNAKLTNRASVLETVINLSLSVILAKTIGLYGVLIATIIALGFKTNYIIIIANKKILNRRPIKTFLILGINCVLFVVIVIFDKWIDLEINTYLEFIAWGIGLCLTVIPIYFCINYVINPNGMQVCFAAFTKKLKNKTEIN